MYKQSEVKILRPVMSGFMFCSLVIWKNSAENYDVENSLFSPLPKCRLNMFWYLLSTYVLTGFSLPFLNTLLENCFFEVKVPFKIIPSFRTTSCKTEFGYLFSEMWCDI